jgi:N-acetylglucosamine kinase-like BadF-type ATPase
MNPITIVVDVGGSTTRFECFNSDRLPLLQANIAKDYPTIKPTVIGYELSAQRLIEYIIDMLNKLPFDKVFRQSHSERNPTATRIVVGSAGVYSDEEKQQYTSLVDNKIQSNPFFTYQPTVHVVSDVELAMIGASSSLNDDAIILIAGTGSMVFARIADTYYRVGGYGLPFSDEGSGEWMLSRLLQVMIHTADEHNESHWLDCVSKVYGVDILQNTREFVTILRTIKADVSISKQLNQKLMINLFDEYEKQELIAVSIIHNAVDELVRLVQRLILKITRTTGYGSSILRNVPIYLHGSIATHPIIRQLLSEQLESRMGMYVVKSKGTVFEGGLILLQQIN